MFPTPDVVRQTLFNRINEMQANSWLYSVDSRDFTRNRKISFSDTILSTISMQRSSQKAEVLKYFDFSSDTPSHSALIQRRNKIPADSFATLFYLHESILHDHTFPKIDYYQIKVKSIELSCDYAKLVSSISITELLQTASILAAFIVNKNENK